MPHIAKPVDCTVKLFDGTTVKMIGVTSIDRRWDLEERDNRDGASSFVAYEPMPTGTLTIRHAEGTYSIPLEYVTAIEMSGVEETA